MHRLGRLAEARGHAELIISLRPVHRARSRGLGPLLLANVLAAQGNPEHACAVAEEVLRSPMPLRCAPLSRGRVTKLV